MKDMTVYMDGYFDGWNDAIKKVSGEYKKYFDLK